VDHLHLAQSTVSKHLACLRACGLISSRSEGRASWFSLTDPERLRSLLALAAAMLSGSGAAPPVHEHLHDPRVAGGPRCPPPTRPRTAPATPLPTPRAPASRSPSASPP